ncbi:MULTISPECIES: ABC transporter ATP-binding protein [unclassified Rathayibacter]|uniref:ABC transporter ATP-binding protein n=1 Tax=unclassified Rathayibacter TaxID=2609250 RepID=UPI000F4C60DC|nr:MULTISPECIES: ABC transporter ATP-binding protein [unclassified Rathayibacter]ROP50574.1 ATP-binding cassette subfamily C protein [Rathayibacter sp. PhB186]ROS53533.1 ATP-binding cassette subfamily C protein [Rathayibacter sp. PhB185]
MTADRLPTASSRTVLRASWSALGRGRLLLPPLVVVLVAAAAAGVVPPLALGAVVDAVTATERDPAVVVLLGLVTAAAVAAGAVLSAVGVVAASRLFERMLAELRERMVDAAFRLPTARVERAGTGDLIARAGDDVAEVSDAIPSVVPAVTGALFTILVTVVGMAVIDLRYAAAMLVVVPVHLLALRWYLRTAPDVYAAERSAMSDRAQRLLDSLNGLETVRAYGLGRQHLERIAAASWSVVRVTMRARAIQNGFFARLNLAELLGMSALLVVGFLLVSSGSGTLGGTTAAMLLFLRLFGPINQLLFVVDELQSALASLGRIVGVITAETPTERPASSSDDLRLTSIHHAHVPGHPVLVDVSVQVPAGTTVAVVGASGAGKSTLAALAAGLLLPDSGAVTRPHRTVLVTQEVHVFDATLRDNLTLAAPDASDTALADALQRVGAERMLARLGLDAPLGASGAALTPAEAQQLALARVLLADPAGVILDEATAEAGSTDAGLLGRAAAEVLRGRTALVVAHRLSQAASADHVVLLDAGRIAEQGTHAELLAAGGPYALLRAAWSGLPRQ